jgi:hypothetical protein
MLERWARATGVSRPCPRPVTVEAPGRRGSGRGLFHRNQRANLESQPFDSLGSLACSGLALSEARSDESNGPTSKSQRNPQSRLSATQVDARTPFGNVRKNPTFRRSGPNSNDGRVSGRLRFREFTTEDIRGMPEQWNGGILEAWARLPSRCPEGLEYGKGIRRKAGKPMRTRAGKDAYLPPRVTRLSGPPAQAFGLTCTPSGNQASTGSCAPNGNQAQGGSCSPNGNQASTGNCGTGNQARAGACAPSGNQAAPRACGSGNSAR